MAEFSARYFYRAPLMSNFLSAEVVIYNIFLDISCNVYTLYSTLFHYPTTTDLVFVDTLRVEATLGER